MATRGLSGQRRWRGLHDGAPSDKSTHRAQRAAVRCRSVVPVLAVCHTVAQVARVLVPLAQHVVVPVARHAYVAPLGDLVAPLYGQVSRARPLRPPLFGTHYAQILRMRAVVNAPAVGAAFRQ